MALGLLMPAGGAAEGRAVDGLDAWPPAALESQGGWTRLLAEDGGGARAGARGGRYLVTVGVETPLLVVGLSPRHPLAARVIAGFWLSACTYPIVAGVSPCLIDPVVHRLAFTAAAETFAVVAECLIFWWAFADTSLTPPGSLHRDLACVVLANLASFATGLWIVPGQIQGLAPADAPKPGIRSAGSSTSGTPVTGHPWPA